MKHDWNIIPFTQCWFNITSGNSLQVNKSVLSVSHVILVACNNCEIKVLFLDDVDPSWRFQLLIGDDLVPTPWAWERCRKTVALALEKQLNFQMTFWCCSEVVMFFLTKKKLPFFNKAKGIHQGFSKKKMQFPTLMPNFDTSRLQQHLLLLAILWIKYQCFRLPTSYGCIFSSTRQSQWSIAPIPAP